MDADSGFDHSTFFSPSKARAAQAQAKDWASVDSWLAKRYPSKRLPPFERNEETLQALLELATFNDNADEQRSLVDRVEKASLQAMSRRKAAEPEGNAAIMKLLMSEMEESEGLDALADTMLSLNCPTPQMATMGQAIVDLTGQSFDAEQQAKRAESQVQAIKSDHAKISEQLRELRRDDFEPRSNLPELTAEWTRNTKQLKAKIGEYDDRLAGLRATQNPSVKFEDVTALTNELSDQQQKLADLNKRSKAYQSLPSDPKAAHQALEAARADLRKQVQERDRLFESMVDSK